MSEMSDGGHALVATEFAAVRRRCRCTRVGLFLGALLAVACAVWAATAEREASVSVSLASVRAQPSTTAPVLFRAPRGTVFRVVDQQGDWYLVSAPARQPGYIHRSVVKVQDQVATSVAESPSPQPSATPVATGPKIDHSPLECLPADDFPLVDAGVTSTSEMYRARVYFKAHQFPDWYFIEMKATSLPQYLALLPQPLPGTEQVDYYLEALDTGLQTAKTAHYEPVVSRRGCLARDIGGLPDGARREITIRGTKEGQTPIPPGFSKKGIIAFVAVAGTTVVGAALTSGTAATAATGGAAAAGTAGAGGTTTAAAAGTAGAATGGGISTATLAIVGGGVVAAGAGVAVATSGGSKDSSTDTPVNLAGSWSGSATINESGCSQTATIALNITHSGSTIGGNGVGTIQSVSGQCYFVRPGMSDSFSLAGTAESGRLRLTTFLYENCAASANYTGTRISDGTYTCPSGTRGTWSATRK